MDEKNEKKGNSQQSFKTTIDFIVRLLKDDKLEF